LKKPYASFLESTTMPIMPKDLWENTPIELNNANINPVGSGPYMIEKTVKKSSGAIDYFDLVPFKKFALGKPYIKNLRVRFYPSEEDLIKALTNGEVNEINSITPVNAEILREKNYKVASTVLPRVFGLFFNQNQNQIFTDKAITRAINGAIDKNKIIKNVLFNYATTIDSPIPPGMLANQSTESMTTPDREKTLEKIESDLAKAGWKKGTSGFLEKTTTDNKKKKTTKTIEFSISTGNTEELVKTAILIKEDLEKIGMKVDVKTFETGNLNQNVIRPRKYDVLLFGEIINHESDLFAFWHSSQRRDPGLNVAMYTNAKVDKILEDAFITVDETNRIKKYQQFESEIDKDIPAVFLYSPNFIYVIPKDLKNAEIRRMIYPSDIFANVFSWYINTEKVWKIFAKNY
jgi:peptide/nickel transport system substrate-binding protein